jgi:hypothetical protein
MMILKPLYIYKTRIKSALAALHAIASLFGEANYITNLIIMVWQRPT